MSFVRLAQLPSTSVPFLMPVRAPSAWCLLGSLQLRPAPQRQIPWTSLWARIAN